MKNEEIISRILNENGITEFAFLPFSSAPKANLRLWQMYEGKIKTCIMLLFPYKASYTVSDSYVFSAYARTRDYHKRCRDFFDTVLPILRKECGHDFEGFADHSPIGEISAAAKCGLGVIGKNSLLINKRYGSFVFIASILTDAELKSDEIMPLQCIDCGRCKEACPVGAIGGDSYCFDRCLSHVSQKKVKTPEEWAMLKKYNVVWGCDICQNVCPLNKTAEPSNDEFFKEKLLTCVSAELIEAMDENTFNQYPFSWRKKEIILSNFKNCASVID